jgi:hypothetical protein
MYYAQRNIRYVKSEQEAIIYKENANLPYIQFVTVVGDSIVIKKL